MCMCSIASQMNGAGKMECWVPYIPSPESLLSHDVQSSTGGLDLDRKQQELLMLESTHVWSRVMGKSLSDYTLEYCCNMPFGVFMDEEFPVRARQLEPMFAA